MNDHRPPCPPDGEPCPLRMARGVLYGLIIGLVAWIIIIIVLIATVI